MNKNTTDPAKSANSLSYLDAGVDIDAGNELVQRIKPIAASTHNSCVLGNLGGFGALYELPLNRYKNPVLVSATDGVGTKLKLAIETEMHDGIGIDLVAMCVNDLIVCGADPLFFLDYYATGKLKIDTAERIIASIAEGCKQAGAALVGGETAEMPGMYQAGDYDLAGFSVGIVEKNQIIDGKQVAEGDILLGLASSGPHANGYSLIRKILSNGKHDLQQDSELANTLLAPTRIYVKAIQALQEKHPIHALAHITGGGLTENLPRVLPKNCQAIIQQSSWQTPAIFSWLQQEANLSQKEMWRTFNCGIGMVIIVPQESAEESKKLLENQGEIVFEIGKINHSKQPSNVIFE